ncbi:MAG TPA: hypothetical protein VKU91_05515, partial [Acidimicrobiales bacterium]|nr:hypothetical protein [Acidimicrobiales bacterium]
MADGHDGGYSALTGGAGALRIPRDVLAVSGPEAETYLQGQLSQDVSAIAEGASRWSLLLAPAGRVDALVRVSRLADGSFVVDTDAGWGDLVAARLNRFK